MNERVVYLTFTDAFFYWRKRYLEGKERREFGEFLDSCDKKMRRGYYGVKI